ncbi:condensation domain-containing protein, partial [Chitinophaga sp.]|uniref:condensation domain-containing protein n=1 Tax=Chitinophaga sp. TaxID=1869181 RepID=UPI002F92E587
GPADIVAPGSTKIIYNYLGQFDSDTRDKAFTIANESTGDGIAASEIRNYDVELLGMVSGGCLRMSLTYSKNQYHPPTMHVLMSTWQESLKTLINYCLTYGKQELTPSDLTYKGLSISQLEELQKKLIKL